MNIPSPGVPAKSMTGAVCQQFRDVKDPYPPRAIVQMPRIWKYGMLAQLDNEIWDITCRAALI